MRRKCSFVPTALFNLCGRSVHFWATYSINAVTSDFSVENQNYLYDCTIIKDIYDIDIFDELDGANEYTSVDLQRQTKSKIDRETLNAIEYHSYNYNLDYKMYLDNKSMRSDESILNKFNNEVTHHESVHQQWTEDGRT